MPKEEEAAEQNTEALLPMEKWLKITVKPKRITSFDYKLTWCTTMPVWTCPNTQCTFDEQLKSGQNCPLCGKEAQAFDFDEFGNLLKEKWKYKKSTEKNKENAQIARRVKFCPKCGSPNINCLIFYRPSMWKCLDCGYEGALIVEDGTLAEKIREKHQQTHEEK